MLIKVPFWKKNAIMPFYFGLSSGIVSLFIFSVLVIYLKDWALSLQQCAHITTCASLPYALKIVIAPLIEKIKIPYFTSLIGSYGKWAMLSQMGISLSFIVLAFYYGQGLIALCLLCFFQGLCACIQDIVFETYRIQKIPFDQQTTASASSASGYRIGAWGVMSLPLIMAQYTSWPWVLCLLSLLYALFSLITFWLMGSKDDYVLSYDTFSIKLYFGMLYQALKHLKNDTYLPWVVTNLLTFRTTDIFLRTLLPLHLLELGYSKYDIAVSEKGLGGCGIFIGIYLAMYGLKRPSGTLKNSKKDILFSAIPKTLRLWHIYHCVVCMLFYAHSLGKLNLYTLTVLTALLHISSGLYSTTSTTYTALICKKSQKNIAIQYAFLGSIGSLFRTIVSGCALYLAHYSKWGLSSPVLLIAALLCCPGIILSSMKKPFFNKQNAPGSPLL